jgi:hypothetical protein
VDTMDVERPRRTSPARGIALIATAVAIGLFILRNGYDTSSGDDQVVAERSDETTVPGADGGTGTGAGAGDPTATTAAPQARPAGEVTVTVANTTGVAGAAGALSETLAGAGFQTGQPTDAEPALELTQVLFVPGFQAEAQVVAETVGAPPGSVAAMPDPVPVADLGAAQVLVMLGNDITPG